VASESDGFELIQVAVAFDTKARQQRGSPLLVIGLRRLAAHLNGEPTP
jgi:hypothetical protein